jgi:serine protease AprX
MLIRLVTLAVVAALATGCAAPNRPSRPDVAGKIDPGLLRAAGTAPNSVLSVIVRETAPASSDAEAFVRRLGGKVTHDLPIIGGFSALLTASDLNTLASSNAVWRVWGDGRIRLHGDTGKYDKSSPNYTWQKELGLPDPKYDGSGVTVALLDSGIIPSPDLGNRILATADFTSEGDGLDRYGHGTHLAGIIAGDGTMSAGLWTGVAKKANLVSVKVAGADGSTDVSVVIAGLQWVVANRTRFNIRVLNLSFGTDSIQPYALDPLDYAVEQAWFSGILVVVSAGNRAPGSSTINKPADDPYVVTVGGADLKGSTDYKDDIVADFSSRGPTQDGLAKPDLISPAITIVSLRDPGSTIDSQHPAAAVDANYMKGTGTSQATAIVSGIAALMFQAQPGLTPDVIKAELIGTTKPFTASVNAGGAGLVYSYDAAKAAASSKFLSSPANQGLTRSTGLGSLEASRGSFHVNVDMDGDGVLDLVAGEIGFGWTAGSWSASSWSASSWSASSWSASSWSAGSWSASSWSASSWSASSWSASSWSASSWSASSWSGYGWS